MLKNIFRKSMSMNQLSFDELTEREPFILSDTDTYHNRSTPWYRENLYYASSLKELDTALLESVIAMTSEQNKWWAIPNIYAAPLVYREIERFYDILHEKLCNLVDRERRRVKRRKCIREAESEETADKRALLEKLCMVYRERSRIAHRSIYKPSDAMSFDAFETTVRIIAEHTGAKIDYSNRYERIERKSEDLHADEQLVALALFRSLKEHKTTAIVTPDSDIARLTADVVCSLESLDGSMSIAQLRVVPVRVYFFSKDDDRVKCTLDTSSEEALQGVDVLQIAPALRGELAPYLEQMGIS